MPIGALLQQRLDAMAQEWGFVVKHLLAQGSIPYPVPAGEHASGAGEQLVADAPGGTVALGHFREVAQLVSPAQLAALGLDPGVGGIAVRYQDAGKVLAKCRPGRLRTARCRCQEQGDALGRHQPQPPTGAALLVHGLIGMHHGGSLYMGVRVGGDGVKCIHHRGLAFADGADRQVDVEQVAQQAMRLRLVQVIGSGGCANGRQ